MILNETRIDDIQKIDLSKLTHEGLKKHYGTGRGILIGGSGRDKKYRYRIGIATDLGDIEESVWCELVEILVVKENDQSLLDNLREWLSIHSYDRLSKEDLRKQSLEYYAAQMHIDREWCDYILFNQKYYPERLDDSTLVEIVTSCCKKPCKVTPELISRQFGTNSTVRCPICAKYSTFEII